MQNLNYENQGNNTYLVYEIGEEDIVDSMSLGMLTNNRISGLAQTIFTQMDSKKFIKFNVSAKVSVSQFFAGAVNKKRLLGVFEGIVNAMLSAEDYMLDTNTILLDMDYIFADVSTCETVLVCLPIGDEAAEKTDLRSFFRDIMFNTQFDQTENCDHVAKLINYLNGTPRFSLMDFKKVLEDIQEEAKPVAAPPVQQPKPAQPSRPAVTPPPVVQPQVAQPQAAQPMQPMAAPQPAVQAVPVQAGGVKPPVPPVPTRPAMQVPPQPAKVPAGANTQIPQQGNEKEISFMYLMQHYNKDNAATYKSQKEARKKAAAEAKGNAKEQKKQKKASGKKKGAANQPPMSNGAPAPAGNFGFAVPGQPAPVSTPAPQPFNQSGAQPMAAPPPAPTLRPAPPQAPVGNFVSSGQPFNNPTQSPVPQPAPVAAPTPVSQPAFVSPQMPQGQAMNFGETTVLGGGAIGETTVLNAVQSPGQDVTPYLIRSKNNEKILLNKPVFRIGKEKSYVDYFIGDNTAISRSHANFITRDGEYLVVDTNSTNHTFVNGGMIQSNVETKIAHGDKIRLANEEFEFKLY